MSAKPEYACTACGRREQVSHDWLALRVSPDRRGIEVRRFEDSGPDDVLFCSETCAFHRISEVLGDRGDAPPKK
jgi:hypothetical protein